MEPDRPAGDRSPGPWPVVRAELAGRDAADLSAADLDLLADAHFWLDEVEESIAVRRLAYSAHDDAADEQRAALAAWRLFYDHFLVGETAVANGWFERCRSHVADDPDGRAAGWYALARSDVAAAEGDLDGSLHAARRAATIAATAGDRNLMAMAAESEGRRLLAVGNRRAGVARLDEAMVAVTNGELDDLYTGWVFCNVVSTCYQLADLGRADQWSRAALRWCDQLKWGRMYPGLCRVYAVELACLRGAWDAAEAEAVRACEDLEAFDPRYAGEAYYQRGELHRLRGELAAAEVAYERAHQLGRVPQPGLALVLARRGAPQRAVTMLRTMLAAAPTAPLPHAQFLHELIGLELAAGAEAEARRHTTALERHADVVGGELIAWLALAASGRVLAADGDHGAAYDRLQAAAGGLLDCGAPYEAARVRLAAADAALAVGDTATARLDGRAALASFERLGAVDEIGVASAWLAAPGLDPPGDRTSIDPDAVGDGSARSNTRAATVLTPRQVEVVRLVAAGATNRAIAAELNVSTHTVNRHLVNIFTRIGVSSRAAATAYAVANDLVRPDST